MHLKELYWKNTGNFILTVFGCWFWSKIAEKFQGSWAHWLLHLSKCIVVEMRFVFDENNKFLKILFNCFMVEPESFLLFPSFFHLFYELLHTPNNFMAWTEILGQFDAHINENKFKEVLLLTLGDIFEGERGRWEWKLRGRIGRVIL